MARLCYSIILGAKFIYGLRHYSIGSIIMHDFHSNINYLTFKYVHNNQLIELQNFNNLKFAFQSLKLKIFPSKHRSLLNNPLIGLLILPVKSLTQNRQIKHLYLSHKQFPLLDFFRQLVSPLA